ncbi:MAG TPA: glycoside hydrolase family 2 protein [Ktedonobacteraceae bacterium]|nr:glycoside hydrolase family 2 protein [Ktedonobacteraceae bacterium]
MQLNCFDLSANWHYKLSTGDAPLYSTFSDPDGWHPAQVPGTIHQDLLAAGTIPDPFVGLNEQKVQWVGEHDWLYRCTFELPDDWTDMPSIHLCCDGLDTYATVWLNGTQVLQSDNMFLSHRIPVKSLLRPGENSLFIAFRSAWNVGKELEATHGKLIERSWVGDSSRFYVRKAQYHYGWDWGPVLMTTGIWRPIRLEAFAARIDEITCLVELSDDLQTAHLPIQVSIEAEHAFSLDEGQLLLEVYAPSGERVAEATLPVNGRTMTYHYTIERPQLWWPNGYGEQALYTLVATLSRRGQVFDQRTQRLGIRRLRLMQQPLADANGTNFFFEVNNQPIFCSGANWIPADSFTPRLTPQDYRAWLQFAADAHMVMIRVWGGGIYEDDVFYNLCDEMGLLIWQDFMFACGIYPAHDWFLESVREEARATVLRLRHHPSLALWCGNNEDYMVGASIGIYNQDKNEDVSTFPARIIYEQVLPEVCQSLDPQRAYWPGSPYGGSDGNGAKSGDQHIWSVWHHPMAPYHDYASFPSRFVSEFGMQSLPHPSTIAAYIPETERYAQSRTMEWHNKGVDGPRRLSAYITDTVRTPSELGSYIYATQFIQSEALTAGFRAWRRRWNGAGGDVVGGALVWQLNDCWPVTSWAIVDYTRRPKPAYYSIRRALAPIAIELTHVSPSVAALWAATSSSAPVEAELLVTTWTLDGVQVDEQRRQVLLAPNQATELGEITAPDLILGAMLLQGGSIVARATLWPEPFKYLTIPDPEISLQRVGPETVLVRARRPAKGVWLSAADHVTWSDNMLDLLPHDPQLIQATGLGDGEIHVQHLGRN